MMKILCDVHISFKIVRFFESKGVKAIHVNNILDGDHSTDEDISAYADKHGYTVLTKDSDFKNGHFVQGTPARLLKVNLGNISTQQLIVILDALFDLFVEHFIAATRCVEIYPDRIEIHKC